MHLKSSTRRRGYGPVQRTSTTEGRTLSDNRELLQQKVNDHRQKLDQAKTVVELTQARVDAASTAHEEADRERKRQRGALSSPRPGPSASTRTRSGLGSSLQRSARIEPTPRTSSTRISTRNRSPRPSSSKAEGAPAEEAGQDVEQAATKKATAPRKRATTAKAAAPRKRTTSATRKATTSRQRTATARQPSEPRREATTRPPSGCQRPVNSGVRFSRNARGPSLASSEENTAAPTLGVVRPAARPRACPRSRASS